MSVRIAKFIADSGVASRRAAEEMILSGRVAVNGTKVNTPVFFVEDGDIVSVDGKDICKRQTTELYAFHKPINTMTTLRDPDGRRTIYECMPDEYKHLKYIGRLDYKTTGLLLMTNDGELARKLTMPSSGIPRVYLATVTRVDISGLKRARQGITVDGIKYAPMKIDILPEKKLRVTITEGKKNEVRIVLRACGCPVVKLHREKYGKIALGKLPVGKIEKLSQKVIDETLKSL